MKFDYDKLREKIIEKYGSYGVFAEKLNKRNNYISKKLNNQVAIVPAEIIKWSKELEIAKDEIGEYFYTEKSN